MNNETRKIVLDLAVSLDGYIEGENGEIDWCIMEEDMDFSKFLDRIDTILFGRKSYELFVKFASTIEDPTEKEMLDVISNKKKYVFSKTLENKNKDIKVIRDNIKDEMYKLKQEVGKDIWLYGGSELITSFVNLELIDEYRLSVHPIILGKGKPLFVDIDDRKNLVLIKVNSYSSGVVQLIYNKKEKI